MNATVKRVGGANPPGKENEKLLKYAKTRNRGKTREKKASCKEKCGNCKRLPKKHCLIKNPSKEGGGGGKKTPEILHRGRAKW